MVHLVGKDTPYFCHGKEKSIFFSKKNAKCIPNLLKAVTAHASQRITQSRHAAMFLRHLGQQGVTTWTTLNYLHPRSLSVVGGLGGLDEGHPHYITHAKSLSRFSDNLDNRGGQLGQP